MKLKDLIMLLFIALIGNGFLTSNSYAGELKDAEVKWTASANPGLVKIDATGGKARGSWNVVDGMGSGKFEVDLKDFKTGIGLRDEHMKKKYLNVAKFPKAILIIDPVKVSDSFEWKGNLYLKGVTKPITGGAVIKGGEFQASFTVNIEDYPTLEVPSYLGVTMAKSVAVTVTGKL